MSFLDAGFGVAASTDVFEDGVLVRGLVRGFLLAAGVVCRLAIEVDADGFRSHVRLENPVHIQLPSFLVRGVETATAAPGLGTLRILRAGSYVRLRDLLLP